MHVHAFDEQAEDVELLFQLERAAPACGPIEGQLCFPGPDCICVQALSVGIFPYVLKLLQSSARELRPLLVFIWAKILAVDSVSWVKRSQTIRPVSLVFFTPENIPKCFLSLIAHKCDAFQRNSRNFNSCKLLLKFSSDKYFLECIMISSVTFLRFSEETLVFSHMSSGVIFASSWSPQSCQADLVKDNGHKYFLSVLADSYMPVSSNARVVCRRSPEASFTPHRCWVRVRVHASNLLTVVRSLGSIHANSILDIGRRGLPLPVLFSGNTERSDYCC